jgi:hypothetical protein
MERLDTGGVVREVEIVSVIMSIPRIASADC